MQSVVAFCSVIGSEKYSEGELKRSVYEGKTFILQWTILYTGLF